MDSRQDRAPILVVGAGWSGAVVARTLHDSGVPTHVYERETVVGGHARVEMLNGVVYEPHGAHIFHTSIPEVAELVQRYGIRRRYEHRVLAEVFQRPDDEAPMLLAWPPQVDELRRLDDWPAIERELDALPERPHGEDFETYVISMMGERLYRLFIEGYTRKQWGCDPTDLSSSFAPRRIDLRRDGNTRLFRDTWEFFPEAGVNSAIEALLAPVPVTCGADISIEDLERAAAPAIVITAPLDDLTGSPGELAWRGIRMRSTYLPTEDLGATKTPAYVVNHPSLRVPYTRTVETKHATGQLVAGTVVSEEHPGAPARHYPVPTPGRTHERRNQELQDTVRSRLHPTPTFFCGRLATYQYINQDQAIAEALQSAKDVQATLEAHRR